MAGLACLNWSAPDTFTSTVLALFPTFGGSTIRLRLANYFAVLPADLPPDRSCKQRFCCPKWFAVYLSGVSPRSWKIRDSIIDKKARPFSDLASMRIDHN